MSDDDDVYGPYYPTDAKYRTIHYDPGPEGRCNVTRGEFEALKTEVQRLCALVEPRVDRCACSGYRASPGAAKPHCDQHPQRRYQLMKAADEEEWWLPVMTTEEVDALDY